MTLGVYTIRQLRSMIREIQCTSMGIKDIMLVQRIEDEIARRTV